MNIKFSVVIFSILKLSVLAGNIKGERGLRRHDNDIDESPAAHIDFKEFVDDNNDHEYAMEDDRQLLDCGYRRRMKYGRGYKFYGFVSHLNLLNVNVDRVGSQAWYKASDGKAWPRDICNKRNSIQAVLGCDLYANSVKFHAVHTTSGRVVERVASPEPYVMSDIKGTDVLPVTWPQLGTYNLTVTPYTGSNADGYQGLKMNLLVTVKECEN